MTKTWNDFKIIHSNIEGARAAFENVCEDLFRKKHPSQNVKIVRANPGDEGIDIFLGEIGIRPITVVQCKFFLDAFGDSQKKQINDSFDRAYSSSKYSLNKWILCIAKELDVQEHLLWSNWKDKKNKDYALSDDFITLITGNQLIELLKDFDLYNKHFNMNVENQISEICKATISPEKGDYILSDNSKKFQKSLLKISYAKCKNIDLCKLTKKRCFDTFLLALLDNKSNIKKASIGIELEKLGITSHEDQIQASLKRLAKENIITINDDNILIKNSPTNQIDMSVDIESLEDWVVKQIESEIGHPLLSATNIKVKHSIQSALLSYFRNYAYNISFEDHNSSEGDLNSLDLSSIKGNLDDEIFSVLMLILGRLIATPPTAQEEILTRLRKCFLGIQFLGLDKNNCIISKIVFEKKTYLLDTDFALKLIVTDSPSCNVYRMIVKDLINNGAKVIIPIEILEEMGEHAKYSHKSFYYFSAIKNNIDLDLFLEMIGNVFVRGFFSTSKETSNEEAFKAYLNNYYDQQNRIQFYQEYIHDEISDKIEFPDFSKEFDYEAKVSFFAQAKKRSLELTERTKKSENRSEEENKLIAYNDVLLYTNFYIKNQASNEPLQSIVTDATRMLKVALELDIYKPFYIKPQALISYMESHSSLAISHKDIGQSLKNPFLSYAITENWNEVKRLIELGGDFRGKELTRLKHDLKDITQQYLYSDLKNEKTNSFEVSSREIEIVRNLKQNSFKFSGELSDEIERIEKIKSENEELKKELDKYKVKEDKRKKYLKRQQGRINPK